MPEAPEMQALAERLHEALKDAVLAGVDVIGFAALKTVDPLPSVLTGAGLESIGRRGKYLIFGFAPARLILHLSQGGRLDLEDPPKRTRPKGALFRLRFSDAPSVLVKEYGTQRKAHWWVLTPGDPGPLEGLGPEVDTPAFEALISEGADGRRIHSLLRDQRTVAGIGRGYADDILNRARISPYTSLSKLSAGERERLVGCARAVLDEALEHERRRTGGLPAKLGDRFAVHGRAGQPCPACGSSLRRVSFETYEIAYCPACQTGGKVLADRRLSRLVR